MLKLAHPLHKNEVVKKHLRKDKKLEAVFDNIEISTGRQTNKLWRDRREDGRWEF